MVFRDGSRTAATSKMDIFVIIVNGFQPLTVITKGSILDVAAVLDPPLVLSLFLYFSLIYLGTLKLRKIKRTLVKVKLKTLWV